MASCAYKNGDDTAFIAFYLYTERELKHETRKPTRLHALSRFLTMNLQYSHDLAL